MERPKRENYPNGIYGDISYNDRLERYTSYLENRLKEREQALRIHDVSDSRQGEICQICHREMDADYGNVCSECDDSHLDD
jgi:hypothetical protein